ncbi:MAG: FAD-dependent oxidoreductase [Candidatus Humimicrobiaceae bacterium]
MDVLNDFDVVFCGTGASTVIPDIPGADRGIRFENVLVCAKKNCDYWPEKGKPEPVKVGQKVVIWGNHYAACDTAETLAMRGKEVIIITEDKEFCPDIEPVHKDVMMMRFAGGNGQGLEGKPIKNPVKIFTGTTLLEIKKGQIIVINNNMEKFSIDCDDVVFAKTVSNTNLFESIVAAGIKPVINIGDSKLIRNVRGAVIDGAEAGLLVDEGIFMNANNHLSSGLPIDVKFMME